MNSLSNLPKVVDTRKKRVGRGHGTGKGAKSGRGTTRHQAARTTIPLAFEGGQNKMVKRFPLLRGKGRNKSIQQKPALINLDHLEMFTAGSVVNTESLIQEGIITVRQADQGVKVLSTGSLTKSLTVMLPVSKTAKSHIERAGGKVT